MRGNRFYCVINVSIIKKFCCSIISGFQQKQPGKKQGGKNQTDTSCSGRDGAGVMTREPQIKERTEKTLLRQRRSGAERRDEGRS